MRVNNVFVCMKENFKNLRKKICFLQIHSKGWMTKKLREIEHIENCGQKFSIENKSVLINSELQATSREEGNDH